MGLVRGMVAAVDDGGSEFRIEVAIAVLYTPTHFLMQLRDDIPTIVYPGQWALFGGHLDPGETADEAMPRELQEEISYVPENLRLYRSYAYPKVVRHVYQAPLTVGLDELVLGEGWDMDFVPHEQIAKGEYYSAKAERACLISPPHQQILLDFLADQV